MGSFALPLAARERETGSDPHGYGVATHNQADFERIPGLDVITISAEEPQPPPPSNAN